ncbi:cytochrome P450 [Lentzea sp. NPDC051838]|uniref:cytochrome P450 n=1 Tax=Lentzea sp. NPDC051838 TaxID=3154849 RepID=UPI003446C477
MTPEVAEFAALHGPEHRSDPHPRLEWVRTNLPVLRTPTGEYVLTTHAGCRALYDPESFGALGRLSFPGSGRSRTRELMSDVISAKNPPEHTRLRKVFSRDFTMRRINDVQPATAAFCEQLLDGVEEPLRDGETVDVMALIRPIPTHVIAEHLGVPEEDREEVFADLVTLLAAISANAGEDALARGDEASVKAEAYFRALMAKRRANPADDATSAWVAAEEKLTSDVLLSMLWGLIAGGLGTSIAALGSGVLVLLREPGAARWLDRDPKAYAEEVLRYESPSFVGGVPKIALRDVEVDGTVIPGGALVRSMLTSANRDGSTFRDPHVFDPSRDLRDSLAFGHGIHLCLGANMSRMELTTFLPLLHRRFPGLELAGDPVWQAPEPVRGLSVLPVRLRG